MSKDTLDKESFESFETSLEFENRFDDEAWVAYLSELAKRDRDSKWEMGDWLVKGADHYGEASEVLAGHTLPSVYSLAETITGLAYPTLRDLCSTARRCPVSVRTDRLSWSHHRVLVNAKPKATEEELREQLQKAVDERLSVAQFKETFKSVYKPATTTKSFLVEVPLSVWEIIKDYADEEEVAVPEMAADWLSSAAEEADGPQREVRKKFTAERRREKRRKVGRRVARTYNPLRLEQ